MWAPSFGSSLSNIFLCSSFPSTLNFLKVYLHQPTSLLRKLRWCFVQSEVLLQRLSEQNRNRHPQPVSIVLLCEHPDTRQARHSNRVMMLGPGFTPRFLPPWALAPASLCCLLWVSSHLPLASSSSSENVLCAHRLLPHVCHGFPRRPQES